MKNWRRGKFALVTGSLQVIFLVLFGILVEYHWSLDSRYDTRQLVNPKVDARHAHSEHQGHEDLYGMFQDVHVMIFIGFGYLMTFLKRYGFSSVGYNLLVASLVIQWATLMQGFFHMHDGKIQINLITMFTSDFAAAAVLISFGAVLGKLSPIQYVVMAVFEIVVFAINEWIGLTKIKVVDVGGSMFVHVFGAYFGMACSRVMYRKDVRDADPKDCSIYHSDVFSMIGTVFLWLFWPSFNAALATGGDQHRAVLNTYFCLAACAVTAFIVSTAVNDEDKLNMVHIQNATIAGGVAIGTSADLMLHPWGAMLIGMIAAALSVVGYQFLQPFLYDKFKLHDTCGVHNLHGMPGVLAGIVGAITVSVADLGDYGYSLYRILPMRVPENGTAEYLDLLTHITVDPGDGRSAGQQAGYQIAALVTTMAMAIGGGCLTGLILRTPFWNQPSGLQIHDDEEFWEIPDDGFPDQPLPTMPIKTLSEKDLSQDVILNPMHIPGSTFGALPHVAKPQLHSDGHLTGNINTVTLNAKEGHDSPKNTTKI